MNYPQTIFEAIRAEISDFTQNQIEIVPGYTFSQYDTIKKIHKYYNSQYETGNYENVNGVTRKKVFYNINKWRCDVSTKMLDIDTKDFVLISENPATDFNVFLLEKELKAWLKTSKFGKLLNKIVHDLPVYGSVVIEQTNDGPEVVDLRYLMVEQSAPSLDKASYILRKRLMSAGDIRKMSKVWDKADEVIERYCLHVAKSYEDGGSYNKKLSPYAEVYTRYGEVPLSWITGKDNDYETYVYSRFICAGVNDYSTNDDGKVTEERGLILFKEQLDELPFKEVHYNRTDARWLGIGVVEDTFEDQRRVNQVKDQEAKAMELSSLILFHTPDETITKNVMTDVDNGDIIRTPNGIARIDNSMRSLGEFSTVAASYEKHADQMTFSYDVIRGETSAASATATAVINQTQQATSVFDYKREDIGLFLNEFITDLVFPELEDKLNQPHSFRFAGNIDEMEKLRVKAIDGYLRSKIIESGDIPSKEEYEATKQSLLAKYRDDGGKMWIKVNKDFYKNLAYNLTLEITGESKNVQAQLANLNNLLGVVGKNPEVLKNPVVKRLLFKVMALTGMHISELEALEQEVNDQPLQGKPEFAQGQTQVQAPPAPPAMAQQLI